MKKNRPITLIVWVLGRVEKMPKGFCFRQIRKEIIIIKDFSGQKIEDIFTVVNLTCPSVLIKGHLKSQQ